MSNGYVLDTPRFDPSECGKACKSRATMYVSQSAYSKLSTILLHTYNHRYFYLETHLRRYWEI